MKMTLERIRQLVREKNLMKFYKSKEWITVRDKARKRDNFECMECKRQGRYSRVQNVHHIKEVRDYPELALTLSNLECLCIRCHNDIHDRLEQQKSKKFVNEERW